MPGKIKVKVNFCNTFINIYTLKKALYVVGYSFSGLNIRIQFCVNDALYIASPIQLQSVLNVNDEVESVSLLNK